MDIRLKNKDKGMHKVVAALIIIVICATMAAGMLRSYELIKTASQNSNYNYFETGDFQTDLVKYCYGIAYEMTKESEEGKVVNPAELYLDTSKGLVSEKENLETAGDQSYAELTPEDSESEYSETYKNIFNESILNYGEDLTIGNYNLKYYAKHQDQEVGNAEQLKNLNEDTKDYQFALQLSFDSNGTATIDILKGAEAMYFSRSGYINWMESNTGYVCKPIKDMTVVFAVKNELETYDRISAGINYTDSYQYMEAAAMVVACIIGILVVVAFLFPYRWVRRFNILRVPFELWGIAGGVTIAGIIMACQSMVGLTIRHNSITIGGLLIDHNVIMMGNFFVWFGLFLLVFLAVLEFKSIFKLGFKEYIRKRTIVGRIYIALKRAVINTIDYVSEIDLHDNNNKYILKIVGINAIILLIITSLWVAGIPVVIVYSIILFFIIKKYVDVISDKYRKLTKATNQIAEGNLDVTIEEDLGVFNPFKDNLEKIQGGFKKAVEEEVKSQRMKTDLISNVSHDLKTPLTAIITYTDLLKDENLSKEKRSEYVEVLDRKAQRLQVLIEDLFEMSKASSGTMNLTLEQVDVVSLLKQTLVEVEDKLEEANLTLKTNFPAEKIMLELDSERTYRVFENLLLNASKYAMQNTRVFVDIVEEETQVTIAVKNISAEEINFAPNEIVERFVRGDQARNTEGSGLGLAISKSFVELQGGKFEIELDGDLFKAIICFPK